MSMLRLFKLASFFVLLSLAPGAQELLEQVGHRVVSGHSAHATAHPEGDDESSDEHGCGGALHVCHCCRIPVLIASHPVGNHDAGFVRRSSVSWNLAGGIASRILRPPLA